MRELRLVGEDGGDGIAETVADLTEIRLMRYLDKPFNGGFVHCVYICIAVVARRGVRRFKVGVKYTSPIVGFFLVAQYAVGGKASVVVKRYRKAADKLAVSAAQSRCLFVTAADLPGDLLIRERCEKQVAYAVFFVLCDKTARKAGGPAILIVKPCKHTVLLRLVNAGADAGHELIPEVWRIHARTDVHMIAAKSHLSENVCLTHQLVLVKTAVP